MSTQTQIRIPISTLTTLPCPHGPGKWCMECVGDDRFQFEQLAPATEEGTR